MVQEGEFTRIQSIFVRHRNCLMVKANFTDIYTDYYLHLADHSLRYTEKLDQMLKDALAMMTLHLTARPWNEAIAWTVNLRAPRVNLFVTGSSTEGIVVGRIFTEDVREPDRNFFYSQTNINNDPEPRRSTVEVKGKDPLSWVDQFYKQSEQRPARAFRLDNEDFALIAAQPDADLDWLHHLREEDVKILENQEETNLLETRAFRFHCGCTLERILPVLGSWRENPDALFDGADHIAIQCPRCAATYRITREML